MAGQIENTALRAGAGPEATLKILPLAHGSKAIAIAIAIQAYTDP
jgi:hypothetical protein